MGSSIGKAEAVVGSGLAGWLQHGLQSMGTLGTGAASRCLEPESEVLGADEEWLKCESHGEGGQRVGGTSGILWTRRTMKGIIRNIFQIPRTIKHHIQRGQGSHMANSLQLESTI